MSRSRTGLALLVYFVTLLVVSSATLAEGPDTSGKHILWYRSPAQDWEQSALPIGNGRLGGMIFGGVDHEHIQFNEDTLWIGDEQDTGSYQAFGDIHVEFEQQPSSAPPESYRRVLDIGRAVHEIGLVRQGVTYRRTYFSSHPAQVMVLRFTADEPAAHSGMITLTDSHQAQVVAAGNKLTATGSLSGYTYSGGSTPGRTEPYNIALQYEAQLLVLHEGGSVEAIDGGIRFTDCDALTLLLAAGTDYLNQRDQGWKGPHPHARVAGQLQAASEKSFDTLLAEHVRDYQSLFNRCSVDWGKTPDVTGALPTDERLDAYQNGERDPDLEELLLQYARYLIISCSRPGSLPANLQGLWNHSNQPPWRSDYHTDVNIQMNYWFVDAANLSECFEPLAQWFYSIRGVRRDETRRAFQTRGWITHAENGVFGGSTWKWSKGDAAWVAQNLWDHYAFTQDKEYLRERAYPIIKELCEFWVDHLKELPDGTLVSPDGFSPEHGPHEDGVSFDQQLVWDLLTNFLEASEALGVDEQFRQQIAGMRERLLGPQIGRWGQLQEWMVDRDDPQDQHRHLSHMIAVHPGRQISPLTTPEYAEAAEVSMNARGDASTGWSRAWKISIWARLHDGNRSYRILRNMIQSTIHDNLFNTHPPFQIDGNFGYASGVCEMLLQSHMGEIHLLPALPDAWTDGSVQGMRARGGVEVDLAWRGGRATVARLTSTTGGTYRLRAPQGQQIDGPSTVQLRPGQAYDVKFK
jgi:alpha-L-fucosidase 2